jgi:hypothetical protein
MEDMNLQGYFRGQMVQLQWHPFLRAMAQQADTQTLHTLFIGVGQRFAADAQGFFVDIRVLSQLQAELNDFWGRMQWGWVTLREEAGCVEISHHAAPLAEAFGDECLQWSVGFLEGFYQRIFGTLGAAESMTVRAHEHLDNGLHLRLRLGR